MDPGYVVRVEEERTDSIVAAMMEATGDDWRRRGRQRQARQGSERSCFAAESAGEVGDEPNLMTFVHPSAKTDGKMPVGADDGPADSEQSTLKVDPSAPGWTKRFKPSKFLVVLAFFGLYKLK
jgi:hypothetical protein